MARAGCSSKLNAHLVTVAGEAVRRPRMNERGDMRTHFLNRVLAVGAVVVAGVVVAPGAIAQGTFTPGTATTATNCDPATSPTASLSCSVGSVSVSMTAWGYMGSTNGWKQGLIGDFNTNGIGAYTGKYETSSTGQHAFDNITTSCGTTSAPGASGLSGLNSGCGGSIEALMLDFSKSPSTVSLTQVGVGWYSGDADVSVYRWTGSGSPTQPGAVDMTGQGAIAGWTLVGSKDVDGVGNSWTGISSGSSSYFLITTYFGASTANNLSVNDDKFKINTFTVACSGTNGACTPSQSSGVPEPASLALASLGLMAAVGARRRSSRKVD